MTRLTAFGLVVGLLAATASDAAVLCAKRRSGDGFNGAVKIREACRHGETELAPGDVGFCCTASTTSTSSTTMTCPTYTTTTLGRPPCGGSGGFCNNGLCANAHACAADAQSGACGCTGPELPCGIVTFFGSCGGTCPAGQACQLYGPPLPNGCPGVPGCACVPTP